MQLVNFSRYPLHVIMSVERDFPSANYYPFALTEMDSFEERSLHFSPWEDRFIVETFDRVTTIPRSSGANGAAAKQA